MADRNSTPYVAAVVEEIVRHCPMYYTNAAHSNQEEAELGGFTFPKDTVLIVNYGAIQRDPAHFDDPHEFRDAVRCCREIPPRRYLINPHLSSVSATS